MQTREQSVREHHARSRHRHGADHHPSFSSTLLDSIYRSIDDPHPRACSSHPSALFRDLRAPAKKHPAAEAEEAEEEEEEVGENLAHRRRNNRGTLGRWMEKKMCDERVVLRRNSVAATDARSRSGPANRSAFVLSSSSSSSNSSSGGRFSSSESDSTSTRGGAKARSLCCDAPWPKPIRTRLSVRSDTSPPKHPPSSSSDARFSLVKTKAKALRIYDDLKKVKQPISPGNRLSSFLNSLLASKNSKKSKISSSLKQRHENADLSTSGDGGVYDDGAPEEKDAISFSQSKLTSSDALKNAKISSAGGGRLDDGIFGRKSNSERGREPACPPLSRSRSGPSDYVSSFGDRSVSSFAKVRSVRFNLPEEDEAAAAAAPTRAFGVGVAEAVRETARLKRNDPNESGGSVARDRSAEEDDGYSSSDLFELDNLTDIGHR
ncbi:hypothetical protein EUGRSUZ_F03172 [Eucalyptus grandis]|uniref:Uncharacterized protein n=2 Tax=Eucalyptus grandis TaxID=71139 RepID=A0ACC3KKC3_EUCGR|nr:hypothetical protein EUGRSUZ_F03172 [Eucalyptus grandis]